MPIEPRFSALRRPLQAECRLSVNSPHHPSFPDHYLGSTVQRFATLLVALLIAVPTPPHRYWRAESSPSCGPVDDRLRTGDTARIRSGAYRLTVVGTTGHMSGHRTSGVLELCPPSTLDRSPTWPGERPPADDTAEAPLYGAT